MTQLGNARYGRYTGVTIGRSEELRRNIPPVHSNTTRPSTERDYFTQWAWAEHMHQQNLYEYAMMYAGRQIGSTGMATQTAMSRIQYLNTTEQARAPNSMRKLLNKFRKLFISLPIRKMATHAIVGAKVKEEFIPTKRLEKDKSYQQLLDEKVLSRANKTFVVVDSPNPNLTVGEIVTLEPVDAPGQCPAEEQCQLFKVNNKAANNVTPNSTRFIMMTDVTPISVADIDKKSCIVERDYKAEAIEKFNKELAEEPQGTRRAPWERAPRTEADEVEIICPGCGENLVERGIHYVADITENRTMALNQYGEHIDTEYHDQDTQEERDHECPECGHMLGDDILSLIR